MRTLLEINRNRIKCGHIMRDIDTQISLLENEYQKKYMDANGFRNMDFDIYIKSLNDAKSTLSALAHMEKKTFDETDEEVEE